MTKVSFSIVDKHWFYMFTGRDDIKIGLLNNGTVYSLVPYYTHEQVGQLYYEYLLTH